MKVSRLVNDDWTFGKGLANYTRDSSAIKQNVVTRLRSFANDWFLDTSANIDWFNILGVKNNQNVVESEIRRVVLATEGILTIDRFEVLEIKDRNLTIGIEYTTIFDDKIKTVIGI
jgi:hypothetical protein